MDTDKHRCEREMKFPSLQEPNLHNLNLYLSVCIGVHLWAAFWICISLWHFLFAALNFLRELRVSEFEVSVFECVLPIIQNHGNCGKSDASTPRMPVVSGSSISVALSPVVQFRSAG